MYLEHAFDTQKRCRSFGCVWTGVGDDAAAAGLHRVPRSVRALQKPRGANHRQLPKQTNGHPRRPAAWSSCPGVMVVVVKSVAAVACGARHKGVACERPCSTSREGRRPELLRKCCVSDCDDRQTYTYTSPTRQLIDCIRPARPSVTECPTICQPILQNKQSARQAWPLILLLTCTYSHQQGPVDPVLCRGPRAMRSKSVGFCFFSFSPAHGLTRHVQLCIKRTRDSDDMPPVLNGPSLFGTLLSRNGPTIFHS